MESCYCNLEVEVNGDETFMVDKAIIAQYSSKLARLFGKSSGPSGKLKVIFHDFPGGAEGFELMLKFCYNNGSIDMNSSNLLQAHCAAEYMEMKDSVLGVPNLLEQTEKSLEEISYWRWSELLVALKQCQNLSTVLDYYSNSMMLEKCMDTIVGRMFLASEASPCPSTCSTDSSSGGVRFSCDSKSTESIKTSSFSSRPCWWFEDLVFLNPVLVEMLVRSMITRKLEHGLISRFLMYYQKARFSSTIDVSEKIKILEMVIDMHYDMEYYHNSTIPFKTLFGILRISLSLNISKSCRHKLEAMIGSNLDQATLDNLLVPSPYGISYLYDVKLVLKFLKAFLRRGGGVVAPTRMKKVASLIDLYIAEIAPDPSLRPSKFLALATAIPDSARDSYDELYHAMDMYLEVHGQLSEEEKLKICCGLNYDKLSPQACIHLSQNPKFPSKSAVQALISQQSKLKNLIQSTPATSPLLNGSSPPFCFTNVNAQKGNKDKSNDQVVLYSSTGDFDASSDNERLKAHLQGMQWRVMELEKICKKMQTQMAKITKSKVPPNSYARSLPKLCS
ncbi:BTB/POZ domain-containing protein At3g22104 isoform X1 [Arachis stenosperma]|uniref:BTB/POZ domain-containing protein At3g22104 isoform X1 n=1 Tax=Arachis stenosperma TaxID=217475 RepID=UPI0025ACCD81|nr:BTB/POZ domain-containing protein At3g22104 isoform X1 [Arachis stenosperma]